VNAVARRLISSPQLTLVPPPESTPDDFARPGKRKRATGVTPAKFAEATARAAAMIVSSDWTEARAIDFVALYTSMHEKVYGVAPVMTSADRLNASFAAAACMRTHFGNEPQELADFIWWTWKREIGREKFRRENGRDGGSISWALQFSGRLLTDYRISMVRESTRGK